ncbi:FAR-17a/AIG1-like protein [Halteromyces radiatus]|uniref:FAR-17a/AIG1-like protein n=1 Tax=Halteromyces radiatus TaxID=101107 RepID=UPI00221FA690|nr:FAR-17a/AIG1-like protein [Halteromyces radiatus]KAI8088725.1 FAR-17a/AIG1-like protein [Halteromyces radiatus]
MKEKKPLSVVSRFSLFLNTIGLVSNLTCLYAVHYVYHNPYANGFGGHFQYLTILGLTWATFAFAINIYRFFCPTSLTGLHDLVIHVAIPLEAIVSFLYWGMTYIDPELLIPKEVEPIPWVMDGALHLYPTVLIWMDFLLLNTTFRRAWRHTVYIYGFVFAYYVWSCYCQSRNGYYPYGFLESFESSWTRFSFYFVSGTIAWLSYEAGKKNYI